MVIILQIRKKVKLILHWRGTLTLPPRRRCRAGSCLDIQTIRKRKRCRPARSRRLGTAALPS